MKFKIKQYIATVVVIITTSSCDNKLEVFEPIGFNKEPAMVENITSQSLPGQIKLNWTAPTSDYAYMRVQYYDFLQKKDISLLTSIGTTELIIEETRARFGEYTFKFQSFNGNHESSDIIEFAAQSGPAPTTTTVKSESKVKLEDNQLSTHLPLANGTTVANLLDGDVWSVINTAWEGDIAKERPHWIQIDLKEAMQIFRLMYTTADGPYPTSMQIQISTDGKEWNVLSSYGETLPRENRKEWKSEILSAPQPFSFLRFAVTSSTSGSTGVTFKISELALYDVELEIYDPETTPLD